MPAQQDQQQNIHWISALMQRYIHTDATEGHIFGNADGPCYGVSSMAVQAVLQGKINEFQKRLIRLREQYDNPSRPMSESDNLDTLAFLNGVEFYHQPYFHEEFLKPDSPAIHQSFELSAPYVLPDTLVKPIEKGGMGGVSCATQFSGVYSDKELGEYFITLKSAANKTAVENVALILRNEEHAISVGYDIEAKQWYLVDTKNLPGQFFKSENEIALAVKQSMGNHDNSIFSTSWHATNKNMARTLTTIDNWATTEGWRNMHSVTATKAKYKNKNNETWLTMAVIEGDDRTVDELLAHKAKVNLKLKSIGAAPLWLAAWRDRTKIVEKLLKNGARVDETDARGTTALHTVTKQGYFNTARVLLDHKANPEKRRKSDGATALQIAERTNQPAMRNVLIAGGAKWHGGSKFKK